eukprot:jgi/Mesen1/8452/ME000475S07710
MKFGKRLRIQVEDTLPHWRSKFLSYKQLKKRLKSLQAPDCYTRAACQPSKSNFSNSVGSLGGVHAELSPLETYEVLLQPVQSADPVVCLPATKCEGLLGCGEARQRWSSPSVDMKDDEEEEDEVEDDEEGSQSVLPPDSIDMSSFLSLGAEYILSREETDFIKLLNYELEKFNNFFIEKEEDFVIRLHTLKERIDALSSGTGGRLVFKGGQVSGEVLDIRRELILKKHDKIMGTVLRLPLIDQVLRQPFFTTELLSELVRECEAKIRIVFPTSEEGQASTALGSRSGGSSDGGGSGASFRHRAGAAEEDDVTGQLQAQTSPSAERECSGGSDDDDDARGAVAAVQESRKLGGAEGGECAPLPHGEDVDSIYRSTLAALRTLQDMRGSIGAAVLASQGRDSVSALTRPGSCAGHEEEGVVELAREAGGAALRGCSSGDCGESERGDCEEECESGGRQGAAGSSAAARMAGSPEPAFSQRPVDAEEEAKLDRGPKRKRGG